MRLEPIERPTGLLLRWAYRQTKRQLGRVITPLKVVYARAPRSLRLGYEMSKYTRGGMTLDPRIRLLIQAHVAQLNGCAFCVDIAHAFAEKSHIDRQKMARVSEYATDDQFTDRERAALRYVEQATVQKHVDDATFETLREHYSEQEIVEMTLMNAIENFYNLVNIPLEIESDGLCYLPRGESLPSNSHILAKGTSSR